MIFEFPDAFEMFDDVPQDCHRHCKCYTETGKCCDCGDELGPVQAAHEKASELCPECGTTLDSEALESGAVAQCGKCGARYASFMDGELQSLTFVEEIPHEECMGG